MRREREREREREVRREVWRVSERQRRVEIASGALTSAHAQKTNAPHQLSTSTYLAKVVDGVHGRARLRRLDVGTRGVPDSPRHYMGGNAMGQEG